MSNNKLPKVKLEDAGITRHYDGPMKARTWAASVDVVEEIRLLAMKLANICQENDVEFHLLVSLAYDGDAESTAVTMLSQDSPAITFLRKAGEAFEKINSYSDDCGCEECKAKRAADMLNPEGEA
jgi:hypothetical protein